MVAGEFDVGRVVARKYRIEKVLGEGGIGRVVAATHLELDQLVAIKHLRPEMATSDSVCERFAREARLAARIRCEHVVRVLDVARTESGCPYMVMEFLEGRDLGQVLVGRGPLPILEAVGYVLQACEALAEAHALGVVHRDLKPENLFLADRAAGASIVKVLDFGISKMMLTRRSDPMGGGRYQSITTDTDKFGTPAYMSPEQLKSAKNVDIRTDVWSLGVVLYEFLSAKTPFEEDENFMALCMKIANEPPTPIRRRRTNVPAGLESIILRCLQKDPQNRYQDIAALAKDLAPFGPPESKARAELVKRVLVDGAQRARSGRPLPGTRSEAPLSVQERASAPTQLEVTPRSPTISSWAPNTRAEAWAKTLAKHRSVGLILSAALLVVGMISGGVYLVRARPIAAPSPTEGHAAGGVALTTTAPPMDPSSPVSSPEPTPAPPLPEPDSTSTSQSGDPTVASSAANPSTQAPGARGTKARASSASPAASSKAAAGAGSASATAASARKNADFGDRQ